MRGMWQGMMGARRDIRGKVPLMGDDKGGKSPRAFHSGMQSGYKTITGKDYETFDPWKVIGSKTGAKRIDEYKDSKYALQGKQASLDAELQSLYDQLKNTSDPDRRRSLTADIEANRSQYGKISKHISVIDDQIKDVKRLYHVDDSPQKDLDAAMSAANEFSQKSKSKSPRTLGAKTPKLEKIVLSEQRMIVPSPAFVAVTRGKLPYVSSGVARISAKKLGLV